MRIFELKDGYSVVCNWRKTQRAFKHEARLFLNGREFGKSVKINYLNRTWEAYEYQGVLGKCIEENFKGCKEFSEMIDIFKGIYS